jgi:hypothetical protein
MHMRYHFDTTLIWSGLAAAAIAFVLLTVLLT